MAGLQTKRVYEPVSPDDGIRILVDRIWPRGFTRAKLKADLWVKDAAPSTNLRTWFAHDPAKWKEFKARYFAELDSHPEVVNRLREQLAKGPVTLLYSARDTEFNQAKALEEYLRLSKKIRIPKRKRAEQ